MKAAPKTVLFLCTGNYYRSRFAEEFFNAKAAGLLPHWRAVSRALALERGAANQGPISPHARAELERRNIRSAAPLREPLPCTEDDLTHADHIIALKEMEHRPMIKDRFPDWLDRVEYWHVHDLDLASPERALSEITENVERLIGEMLVDFKKLPG